jgi:hypothetical protein
MKRIRLEWFFSRVKRTSLLRKDGNNEWESFIVLIPVYVAFTSNLAFQTRWRFSSRSKKAFSYLPTTHWCFEQGILKRKVSLYHWPPVWLIWNQLNDNWQFLFIFSKQTNPNQSNRRSMVQWYFPLQYSLLWVTEMTLLVS